MNFTIPENLSALSSNLQTQDTVPIDVCQNWCHNTVVKLDYAPFTWGISMLVYFLVMKIFMTKDITFTFRGKTSSVGRLLYDGWVVWLIAFCVHMLTMLIFKRI